MAIEIPRQYHREMLVCFLVILVCLIVWETAVPGVDPAAPILVLIVLITATLIREFILGINNVSDYLHSRRPPDAP